MGRGWMNFEVHARNVDAKRNSGESQKEMRSSFLEIGEKMDFILKCEITWLYGVLMFCGIPCE